ncbi:unnamed protein product [Trichogramma brassicae]|uniref:Uncharacterized protein n=1 Tax=Trichogramma brassicae TaxID=86971 RepID=A0A6H5IQZ2_9HYME|nr:unnamed protein product [Trichogramma brassicae]
MALESSTMAADSTVRSQDSSNSSDSKETKMSKVSTTSSSGSSEASKVAESCVESKHSKDALIVDSEQQQQPARSSSSSQKAHRSSAEARQLQPQLQQQLKQPPPPSATGQQQPQIDTKQQQQQQQSSSKNSGAPKNDSNLLMFTSCGQLLLGVILVVFGVLVLVHGASLGQTGAGLWAGVGALCAGGLGVVAALSTSSLTGKSSSGFASAHLASSLVALALSNLAAITALTAVVRDSQRNVPDVALLQLPNLIASLTSRARAGHYYGVVPRWPIDAVCEAPNYNLLQAAWPSDRERKAVAPFVISRKTMPNETRLYIIHSLNFVFIYNRFFILYSSRFSFLPVFVQDDEGVEVEAGWSGLLASCGLLVASCAELFLSGYTSLTLAPKLCSCLRPASDDCQDDLEACVVAVDGQGKNLKTRNMVHQWVIAQSPSKNQPFYVVQPVPMPMHPMIQLYNCCTRCCTGMRRVNTRTNAHHAKRNTVPDRESFNKRVRSAPYGIAAGKYHGGFVAAGAYGHLPAMLPAYHHPPGPPSSVAGQHRPPSQIARSKYQAAMVAGQKKRRHSSDQSDGELSSGGRHHHHHPHAHPSHYRRGTPSSASSPDTPKNHHHHQRSSSKSTSPSKESPPPQLDMTDTYTGLDKRISEEFISIAMDPERKSNRASSHHGSDIEAARKAATTAATSHRSDKKNPAKVNMHGGAVSLGHPIGLVVAPPQERTRYKREGLLIHTLYVSLFPSILSREKEYTRELRQANFACASCVYIYMQHWRTLGECELYTPVRVRTWSAARSLEKRKRERETNTPSAICSKDRFAPQTHCSLLAIAKLQGMCASCDSCTQYSNPYYTRRGTLDSRTLSLMSQRRTCDFLIRDPHAARLRAFTRVQCVTRGRNQEKNRKMASGPVDDVDLIDLESGVCGLNRASVPDATPEEQEHLLDVCPPKLEQKLSLTRRQNEEARRKIAESIDNDHHQDVLVTLGHDQVVPQRKRIDVVSNDTIKRVRDITRNLAPVIGIGSPSLDRVDYSAAAEKSSSPSKSPIKSRAGSIEESFEAREINDAFEFLSEHDDSAEIAAAARSSSNSPPRQASASAFSYPLEPTCYIIEDREKYWSPGLDNEAFEISPTSRKQQQQQEQQQQQQPTMRRNSSAFDLSDRLLAMGGQSVKRLRSLTYSAIGGDIADERRRKKFKGMMYRNSWNGSGGAGSGSSQGASRDLVSKRKKKNGVTKSSRKHLRRKSRSSCSRYSHILARASVFGNVYHYFYNKERKDAHARLNRKSNPSGSSSSAACTGSSASSYSSCSEVDWSWVEEVDCECNAGNDIGNIGNIGIHQRSQGDEERHQPQQRVDEEEEKLVQVKGAKEEALEGSGVTTRQEEDSSSHGLHRASPRTPTSKRMRESSCSSSSGGITPPLPPPPTGRSSDSSNSSSNSGGSVAMSIAASSVQAKSADPSRVTTATTNRSRLVASAGTLVHNSNNHHHHRHQRRRSSSNNNAHDDNNSSAVLDFTSSQDPEAIRLHNRNERSVPLLCYCYHTTKIVSGGGGTLPWLRASMRRLRQLRIPGTGSAANNNSSNNGHAASNAIDSNGPNSLPDIALIAPEILAAQTNDTTGGLLRPSSAPAPNRSMESVMSTPTIDTSSTTTLAATSQAINAASAVIGASSPRRGRRSNAVAAAAAASGRCQASTGASASSSSNNNGTQTRESGRVDEHLCQLGWHDDHKQWQS